jgi:hypothetical protein
MPQLEMQISCLWNTNIPFLGNLITKVQLTRTLRLDNPTVGWLFTIATYVPFAHHKPTWTKFGVNPGIYGDRPATNSITNGSVHIRPLRVALVTETVVLREILGGIEVPFCYSATSVHLKLK